MQLKFYYSFMDLYDLLYETKLYYLLQNLLPFHNIHAYPKNKVHE